VCTTETPPRTWGKHSGITILSILFRNTPTDVGKTYRAAKANLVKEKHPHGRGENLLSEGEDITSVETPPRTWGKLSRAAHRENTGRNTPTDVGKTCKTIRSE